MHHRPLVLVTAATLLLGAGAALTRRSPVTPARVSVPTAPAAVARNDAPTATAPAPKPAVHPHRAPGVDMRVYNFDPRLVGTRDAELAERLRASVPSPRYAWRVGEIARTTEDAATRKAAVDALVRMGTLGAQRELAATLVHGGLPQEDPLRREIAAALAPSSLSDSFTPELVALLDEPSLSTVEKGQVAMTLALVGYRDHASFPAELRERLSKDAQGLLDSAVILAAPSADAADEAGELLSGP